MDLAAQLAGNADLHQAIALLKDAVPQVANVVSSPVVDVEILEFNEFGPTVTPTTLGKFISTPTR